MNARRSSGDITVQIINNNGSKVSQSSKKTDNGMELKIMIDQAVAENIRSKEIRINQAMSNFQNKTLTRR